MSEEQIKKEQIQPPKETAGLSFAITLLVALWTIIYILYNYLQNTPLNLHFYSLICGVFFLLLILAIFLIFYLLSKGYSLEIHDDSNFKRRIEYWASSIYRMVFSMSIILLILILFYFLLDFILKTKTSEMTMAFFITFMVSLIVLMLIEIKREPNERVRNIAMIIKISFLVFAITMLILSNLFYITPLQGHIAVDMESIYYKKDTPIPVLIHVTGPNTNLSIFIVNESDNTLYIIDEITLISDYPSINTVSGKYLFGNALDYGTYNVFINTSNLTAGYYELHCARLPYWKTSGARGFYLVNSSQQSFIGELNAS